MGALIFFLLLPILILLILILFFGIFAYAKIMKMWYQLTGRKQKNGSFFHFNTGSGASWNNMNGGQDFRNNGTQSGQSRSNGTSQHTTSQAPNGQKKIFSKDDGEYVDFEMVE